VRFAIVGDPVDHSLSPRIHNAAFAAVGFDARYEYRQTAADAFDSVVHELRSGRLDGASVTMPHKNSAYDAVDIRSDLAERSGAVNTIVMRGESMYGTNTDVAGVAHTFSVAGIAEDAAILVLGAGGAAAAALVASDGRPLFVSSRSAESSEAVISRTHSKGWVVPWGEGVAGSVVVNATPLGMHGESLPVAPLSTSAAFIDMTYGARESPSLRFARKLGIPVSDGIDMLVGQAVEAFTVFTGLPAPLQAIESAARSGT
jgi:shikimate dehydrogenase